jgi:putative transposase
MVAAHEGQADEGNDELERSESGREAFEALRASGGFDEVLAKIDAGELQLTGEGGFLQEMVKAVLERGLQTELTSHLGSEKGDPEARVLPNARNGFSAKTVSSEVGDVTLAIPRDRDGSFIPTLVPKGAPVVLVAWIR